MHIGVDLRCLLSPYRTGIGEFTYELFNALFSIDKKNDYYLFCNSYSELNTVFPSGGPNVKVVITKFPNKLFNTAIRFTGRPKLDDVISERCYIEKLDYFISPHLNFTSLSKKTKHILIVHDLTFEFFPHLFTWRQRFWHYLLNAKKQSKDAHLIFTPSENTKNDLSENFDISKEKIKVLYPGLSTVFLEAKNTKVDIRKKYQLPENYILFLGTVEPRKNITAVLKAFDFSCQYLPKPYHLVIAGAPGWKSGNLKKLIQGLKHKDKVHFLDYIEETDKPALYRNAALFVYPSLYEGFGFPVLEAMASGVPVITSARSSLPEITGSSAYFINPHKPGEVAEGIIRILNSRNLQERLVIDGKTKAFSFNFAQSANRFLSFLN